MKIIGLLTAWACEDWIEYSIQQALELVDELLISIGPHDKYLKRIKDSTNEKAQKYLNNNKIKFFETICDKNYAADENKCATLNKMIQESNNIAIGNVLWILDSDEFYFEESINEIKTYIEKNDFDQIDLKSNFFCFNLKYYIKTSHIRLFKIKSNNFYFSETQTPNPRPKKTITLLNKYPMFHYSLLTGEQLKGIYWMSYEGYFSQFLWYLKIFNHYDPNNEEYWMKKNQDLTGNYGFWFNDENITEHNGHGLFVYDGKHPDLIENSHLKAISDFREYMKNKPNYKMYLDVIKEVIAEKKKFNFTKFRREKIFKIMTSLRKRYYLNNVIEKINNKLVRIGIL
ncbi:MAG: hypothetical protein ACFFAO_19815 [Candidatus Hermodarchaeota archaeon]